MGEITFEIVKHLGRVGKVEVNYISWCSREPVIDIRAWDKSDPGRPLGSHGITFTKAQTKAIYKILGDFLKE